MTDYLCVVVRGGHAAGHEQVLEERLREAGRALLSDEDDAGVVWQRIEPGHMFTEGQVSDSAIVVRTAPATMSLAARQEFMGQIHRAWLEATGCGEHDLVIALTPLTEEDD